MNEHPPADLSSKSNTPRAEEVHQVLDRLLQLLAEEVARKLVLIDSAELKPRQKQKNALQDQQPSPS